MLKKKRYTSKSKLASGKHKYEKAVFVTATTLMRFLKRY